MKPKAKDIITIHLAVLLFGAAGIFAKTISQNPITIVFGRVFFASIFLFLIMFFFKKSIKLQNNKDYFLLALQGLILAFHWIAFYRAIQLSTVALGLLTFSTFPVFTTFLEPLFFRKKLILRDLVIAIIAFSGLAYIVPDFQLESKYFRGMIWGILSGASFALLSILNKKHLQNHDSITIAFYMNLWACLALSPFLLFYSIQIQITDLLQLIILGVVFTAFAHTLFISGLKTVRAQTASLIATMEPVYGIVLAIFIVNEIPDTRIIIGGIVILVCSLYVSFSK